MSRITDEIISFAFTWERWLSDAGHGSGVGLPPVQERLLVALRDDSPLMARQLEERLALDKGQLSRCLHAMRRKGLITMIPSREDRRALLIEPSPLGLEHLDRTMKQREETISSLLSPLSRVERKELLLALRTLKGLLGSSNQPMSG